MSLMLVCSFLIFFYNKILITFSIFNFSTVLSLFYAWIFFILQVCILFFIFFIFLILRNFCFVCEDFSDDLKDIINGLLGANRNVYLKLISFFAYKDENKLKQVCKKYVCISWIESIWSNLIIVTFLFLHLLSFVHLYSARPPWRGVFLMLRSMLG
jgi:hypothetical protein